MSGLQILPLLVLSFGVLLDAFSVVAFASALIQRRWSSGFPLVGAVCYVIFAAGSFVPGFGSPLTPTQVVTVAATLLLFHIVLHWAHIRVGRSLRGEA